MTTTHTQTSTDAGPDFCAECSEAVTEWVPWPCLAIEPRPSEQIALAIERRRDYALIGPLEHAAFSDAARIARSFESSEPTTKETA